MSGTVEEEHDHEFLDARGWNSGAQVINRQVSLVVAETMEQALEQMYQSFSGEEDIIFGLPKSLGYDIQAFVREAAFGGKQMDKMATCKTCAIT